MICGAESDAEAGNKAETVEDAEETQETEENEGRRFAASRFAFDDVLFSRIASTTLPR